MRILHCSDLHAADAFYRWVVTESFNYELVCLSGDLLDLSRSRMSTGQIDKVVAFINEIRTPLAVCSGNHDSLPGDDARLANAAWLQELRRPQLWIDGDDFILGGHPFRVLPWRSPLPASAASAEIWLIHSPPDRTPTSIVRGGVDFGDFELGELCRRGLGPRLLFSGHVHERQAWNAKIGKTWCLNPGRDADTTLPNSITIDLSRNRATFHGAIAISGDTDAVINLF